MTKEDQSAFLEWKRETAGDTTILIRPLSGPSYDAFQSACAYKQKRIAELKDALMTIGNALAMEDEVHYEPLIRLAYRLSDGDADE